MASCTFCIGSECPVESCQKNKVCRELTPASTALNVSRGRKQSVRGEWVRVES